MDVCTEARKEAIVVCVSIWTNNKEATVVGVSIGTNKEATVVGVYWDQQGGNCGGCVY